MRQSPWLIVWTMDRPMARMMRSPACRSRCWNAENGQGGELVARYPAGNRPGSQAVVTLDSDGQHAPEDILRATAAQLRHRNTIVIGSRLHDKRNIPARSLPCQPRRRSGSAGRQGRRSRTASQDSGSAGSAVPRSPRSCDRSAGFVFESEILIESARSGTRGADRRLPRSTSRAAGAVTSADPRCTYMVAWKLVSRGLDLPGLLKACAPRHRNLTFPQ